MGFLTPAPGEDVEGRGGQWKGRCQSWREIQSPVHGTAETEPGTLETIHGWPPSSPDFQVIRGKTGRGGP